MLELLLYLLSGFLLTLLYFRKLDITKLLALTIGFSISINVLLMFILAFINLSKISIIISLFLILLILFIINFRKKTFYNLKDIKMKLNDLIVFLALIFIFFLIFKVHFSYTGLIQDPHNKPNYIDVKNYNYPYPIHADEWSFLTWTLSINEYKEISLFPFTGDKTNYHLETGSHLFLAEIFFLLDIDPVKFFQFFPAIFAVINSLFLFILTRRLTNFRTGIFAALFFASMQSNTNLLGNWFFTPLTFSLFLIFFFVYLLLEKSYLSYFILFISLIVYPLAFIINILLFLLVKKKTKKLAMTLAIITILTLIFVLIAKFPIKRHIIYLSSWTSFKYIYNIVTYYGIIGFVLAIIGFYKKRFLLPITIFFLINVELFQFFDFTVIVPYTRAFYYYMVSLTIPSAIGLTYITAKIKPKKLFGLAVILLVFTIQFYDYYDIKEQKLVLLHLINDEHYNALNFIKNNYELKNTTILARDIASIPIYPITRANPFAMQSSNIGFNNEFRNYYWEFLKASCENKTAAANILKNENIRFLLANQNIDCRNITKIYFEEGAFVYEFE